MPVVFSLRPAWYLLRCAFFATAIYFAFLLFYLIRLYVYVSPPARFPSYLTPAEQKALAERVRRCRWHA